MKAAVFATIAVVAAVAAGGFAWHTRQALDESRQALADTNAQLEKSKAELRTLQAEAEKLRREAAAQKLALEQLQVEATAARGFLDAERAMNARLREDLLRMQERLAQGARAPAAQAGPTMVPRLAPQPPFEVRMAPSSRPSAVGVGVPAR